jgi:hypothetical protein
MLFKLLLAAAFMIVAVHYAVSAIDEIRGVASTYRQDDSDKSKP